MPLARVECMAAGENWPASFPAGPALIYCWQLWCDLGTLYNSLNVLNEREVEMRKSLGHEGSAVAGTWRQSPSAFLLLNRSVV